MKRISRTAFAPAAALSLILMAPNSVAADTAVQEEAPKATLSNLALPITAVGIGMIALIFGTVALKRDLELERVSELQEAQAIEKFNEQYPPLAEGLSPIEHEIQSLKRGTAMQKYINEVMERHSEEKKKRFVGLTIDEMEDNLPNLNKHMPIF